MDWKKEYKAVLMMFGVFLAAFFLPLETARFTSAAYEALHLVKWYAREHVVLCLATAFFIAGAISVFVSQGSVMKYLGPGARKVLAYGVASVAGTILAVCSCTVLPLFNGIYRMGAGLGPATTFLYSGPAINVLAIVLTARVLGIKLGVARAVAAIVFSIVIGLCMHVIFINEEKERIAAVPHTPDDKQGRALWKTSLYFAAMIGILIFANWAKPDVQHGIWYMLYSAKWVLTSLFAFILGIVLILWFGVQWWRMAITAAVAAVAAVFWGKVSVLIPFSVALVFFSALISTQKGEAEEWFSASWGFARQILPLLLWGVLIAGFLLGRPHAEGIIPSEWVHAAVGGNSIRANLFASVAGAFMYFATLTEVPILQGLIGSGMGQGPALALLLAGPALSLPNMLVIRSVIGIKKTVVFVSLVIIMATLSGIIFGMIS